MIDKPGLQHETVWELYLCAPDQGNVPRHRMYPSSVCDHTNNTKQIVTSPYNISL
jgi:hypothetical protein